MYFTPFMYYIHRNLHHAHTVFHPFISRFQCIENWYNGCLWCAVATGNHFPLTFIFCLCISFLSLFFLPFPLTSSYSLLLFFLLLFISIPFLILLLLLLLFLHRLIRIQKTNSIISPVCFVSSKDVCSSKRRKNHSKSVTIPMFYIYNQKLYWWWPIVLKTKCEYSICNICIVYNTHILFCGCKLYSSFIC